MRRIVCMIVTLGLVSACTTNPEVVVPEFQSRSERLWQTIPERTRVDYSNPERWACGPGAVEDACHELESIETFAPDGSVVTRETDRDSALPFDCFFIYPTVDLSPDAKNHDSLDLVELPRRIVASQAGPFSRYCRVIAPYYRQASIGTYSAPLDVAVGRFTYAYADVADAFEYYLAHWNAGRPIVVIGHSQGAQHASYLLHQYFDGDTEVTALEGSRTSKQLRQRLLGALPIGFNVYVRQDGTAGGSFADIPPCQSPGDTTCFVHYRSFNEGHKFGLSTRAGAFAIDVEMAQNGLLSEPFDREAHVVSCVNPGTTRFADAHTDGTALDLDGAVIGDADIVLSETWLNNIVGILSRGSLADSTLEVYPQRYTATCRSLRSYNDYLAIGLYDRPSDTRGDPIGLDSLVAGSGLGLHLWDFHLAMGDLVSSVQQKYLAWEAAQ